MLHSLKSTPCSDFFHTCWRSLKLAGSNNIVAVVGDSASSSSPLPVDVFEKHIAGRFLPSTG